MNTSTAAAAIAGLALIAGAARAADSAPERVVIRATAHFALDSTAIVGADRSRLLEEVGAMQGVTWQTVTATGHTDSVGSANYNLVLARRRAAAVKQYLASQGLPPTLVRTDAKGEAAPVADNDSEAGRAQNRRTEVVFEGVRAPR